jgi:hypothetical protein
MFKKLGLGCLGLIGLFVVLGIIVAALGGGDSGVDTATNQPTDTETVTETTTPESTPAEEASSEEPTASEKPKPKTKAVRVRAGAIVKEFEDNELAADNKYKGKTLRITGVVEKIDTEFLNDEKYILQISSGGDFEFLTVNCHDMSNSQLAKLKKGDDVTAVGKFDDGGDLGVEVKDCALA